MSLLCHRRVEEDVAVALTILAVKWFYCQSLRRSSGALTLRTSIGRSWAITLRICYERCGFFPVEGAICSTGWRKNNHCCPSCRWWEFTHLNTVIRHFTCYRQQIALKWGTVKCTHCLHRGEIPCVPPQIKPPRNTCTGNIACCHHRDKGLVPENC